VRVVQQLHHLRVREPHPASLLSPSSILISRE
jgi:hypothetical protein